MSLQPEKKDKLYAAIGTFLFACFLLFLGITLGMNIPYPIPEESGVEVNVGDSEEGLGTHYNPSPDDGEVPSVTASNPETQSKPDDQSDIATQSTDESITLKPKKKPEISPQKTKPTQIPQSDPEPIINKDALFNKDRIKNTNSTGEGSGEGNTYGKGDRGVPGGDPNSQNYVGSPGKGGVSFSLDGRSSKSLVTPTYTSKDQGVVVVKIWVDKNGNVVKAQAGERGTTVTDHRLHSLAEKAAKESVFTANSEGADIQIGTITYKFVLSR